MLVVLIRHARAEERRLLQRDRSRALTADGRRRFRRAAKGLRAELPPLTRIATSPLQRARETAELLAAVCKHTDIQRLPLLAPGKSPAKLLAWLAGEPPDSCLALIGHEPDLGRLAGLLLDGRVRGFVQFKKGAAAAFEFSRAPRAGEGRLLWLLTAAQLAALG